MELQAAFVVGAVRTPIGKYGGALRLVRPDDLAAHAIAALIDRTGVPADEVEDIFWGAANGAGEDNRNVARMAGLLAGLPIETAGATVNRLCGSGLQAVVSAAREIQVGAVDVVIAGGVESMTRAPFVLPKEDAGFGRGDRVMYDSTLGWRMVNPRMRLLYPPKSLGETAEIVAERYGIDRESQDAFALRSHRRAIAAQETGRLAREIAPIMAPSDNGASLEVRADEGPRADTSLEKLARLRPVFRDTGTVTAGNSSQLNDGAAALLLMSGAALTRLGLEPMSRFLGAATAGVHPDYMGIGPVPSTRKLLARLGMGVGDLDVIELNEAFAAQALACMAELGFDAERVNPNGGAIALGHPLGASGARLVTTLVHELREHKLRRGLAAMCIGVGQGISAAFERVA